MRNSEPAAYTVSQLARLSGVSVRTLHHYDDLGLLRPSTRSEAGYRLYGRADLERLQQVLFFRELEFPLEEIGRILDDPGFDRREALRLQRRMLGERAARVQALIAAVDQALARMDGDRTTARPASRTDAQTTKGGATMETDDLFSVWREAKQYEAEAEARWGHSDEYQQSKTRTAGYTKRDWEAIMAEGGDLFRRLAAAMASGVPAHDAPVMDLAEAHRQHICRWFYRCSPQIHRALGAMYVEDQRFTASIDRFGAGLSAYARDAFAANADRQEGP